jgi:hypothetical protein
MACCAETIAPGRCHIEGSLHLARKYRVACAASTGWAAGQCGSVLATVLAAVREARLRLLPRPS